MILVRVGDAVKAGDAIVELHYREESKCATARTMIQTASKIADSRPLASDLIYEVID
jgi:thymidine phosphorylase